MDTLPLTHAMLTSITAIASSLSSASQKAIDIISSSSSIDSRAEYHILSDYASLPNVITHCNNIAKENRNYADRMMQFVRRIANIVNYRNHTFEESFANRLDVCDEIFQPQFEAIRVAIRDSFNPYKPSDPIALYAIMNALFISDVFESMTIYAKFYSDNFRFGEFNILTRYHQAESLRTLIHRCNFHDRSDRPFVFLMSEQDSLDYQKQKSKKSWQIKHRDNHPVAIEVWRIFKNEKCLRASYGLMREMSSLKTLDNIELLADGVDSMHRKNYSYKFIKSGITFFEQSVLNSVIQAKQWDEVVNRIPQYIDLYTRRQSSPVVCFHAYSVTDSKGNTLYNSDGTKRVKPQFIAIFNSAYEAQNERGVKASTIRKSVNCHGRYCDSNGNIWFSFNDYCNILFATLLSKGYKDLAHKLYNTTHEHITYGSQDATLQSPPLSLPS